MLIEYNSLVVKRVVRLVTIPTTAATNSCRFSLDNEEMDFMVSIDIPELKQTKRLVNNQRKILKKFIQNLEVWNTYNSHIVDQRPGHQEGTNIPLWCY